MLRNARTLAFVALSLSGSAFAQADTFFGWSKDSSWYAYQSVSGPNDTVELFFCPVPGEAAPSWPKEFDALERVDEKNRCVRYLDPNRAPYGWKTKLAVPKSGSKSGSMKVLPEPSTDATEPGFVVVHGDKKIVCECTGVRESTKLGTVFWSSDGRWVAAQLDGVLQHCPVPLLPGKAKPATGNKKAR